MKNIVVCTDFSNSALTAARHAVALAIRSKATLHLVWVKTPGAQNVEEESESEHFTTTSQHKLQLWAEQCKKESPESQINSVILEGKVHVEVTRFANNLPESIIVMGAH